MEEQTSSLFNAFMQTAKKDKRVTSWHISLYFALLYQWHKTGGIIPICISPREIMKLSHIRSIATYQKHINELVAFGYIMYEQSYHPEKGGLVSFHSL